MNTKQVTITGWIAFDAYRAKNPACFPGGPYVFRHYENVGMDEVTICPHSFTAEVPADFDPRPGLVKALEKQKEEARAAFAARVVELDRQINELLAIEG